MPEIFSGSKIEPIRVKAFRLLNMILVEHAQGNLFPSKYLNTSEWRLGFQVPRHVTLGLFQWGRNPTIAKLSSSRQVPIMFNLS